MVKGKIWGFSVATTLKWQLIRQQCTMAINWWMSIAIDRFVKTSMIMLRWSPGPLTLPLNVCATHEDYNHLRVCTVLTSDFTQTRIASQRPHFKDGRPNRPFWGPIPLSSFSWSPFSWPLLYFPLSAGKWPPNPDRRDLKTYLFGGHSKR